MVLMAEDDDAIRPGMSQCLPQRGWHVVEAGHAAAAIEVVESGNLIDLVFYPDARHDGRRGSRAGCARATRRSCSPRAGA
jgi:DNA-binding NtrC family response regulator